MAKLINDKYFLEPGDLIEANVITLKYTGKDYKISSLVDADLKVWVEEDEEDYPVKYAWDIPKSDPNYGKPYYEK